MDQSDRRATTRYAVDLRVVCGDESALHAGKVRDLSEGGAKIYMPNVVPVGTHLRICPIDDDCELMPELPGQVVRVVPGAGPGRMTCLGLEFQNLKSEQHALVRSLLEDFPPLKLVEPNDEEVFDAATSASHFRMRAVIHGRVGHRRMCG